MKYKVEFSTKGAYNVELAFYSEFDDEFGVSIPDIDEAIEIVDDCGDGLFEQGIAKEDIIRVAVKVFKEDTNELVYEMPEFDCEFRFDSTDVQSDEYDDGVYILKLESTKWQSFSFIIEDDKFDFEKLQFHSIEGINGLYADSWTDMNHVTYDNKPIEPEFCYDYDTYGADYYTVDRRDGKWVNVLKIEE